MWRALQFQKYEGHRYHFAYEAENAPPGPDGVSACRFTITARGDLDGDGRLSLVRRAGVIDGDGVRLQPVERVEPLE